MPERPPSDPPRVRGPFHVTSAARTHPGCSRGLNEDAFLLDDAVGLWAVADGMGGHDGGDHASKVVVECLGKLHARGDAHDMLVQLRDRLHAAHDQLCDEARARNVATLGSTVVAFMQMGIHCVFAWVGDSRGYLISERFIERMTRDHSLVQEMVESGQLTLVEAECHPNAHILTRALGANDSLEVEYRQRTLARGDRCLLCSDGLTRSISEEIILDAVQRMRRPAPICDVLIRAALDAGAPDNVTLAVVAFD